MIQSYGCDQEERKLSWETGVEEVGFKVFPDLCNRGAISYLEGERVPQNWGIVTERILRSKVGEVKFGGASYCISE